MQCNQSFCGNGYPNFGHAYTYNPTPVPYNGPSPEIIGEGDVTSLVLPDGSVRYFFTPTTKWWSPYMTQSPLPIPNNPFWHTNAGIWFVRSLPNPIPPYAFNQQCCINEGLPSPRPCFSSECNINTAPPPFHLKFHNDCCTSTTDLHYFFPSISRQYISNFPTQGSAAVQVQLINPNSTETPNVSAISYKPCQCAVKAPKALKCACKLSDNCSSMSIDEKELSINVTKASRCRCPGKGNSATECGCKKSASSISLRGKKSKNRHKRYNLHATSSTSVSADVKKSKQSKKVRNNKGHTCECSLLLTTDKSVTTYMDQASGCSAEIGRETQTVDDCHPVPIIPFVEKVHFSDKCGSECSSSSCDCNHCHE